MLELQSRFTPAYLAIDPRARELLGRIEETEQRMAALRREGAEEQRPGAAPPMDPDTAVTEAMRALHETVSGHGRAAP